jgi:hypothetical protein
VAVFEDLPMGTALLLAMMRLPASAEPVPAVSRATRTGTMNTIYIVRSVTECVGTFDKSEKSERVCDLDVSTTFFLFLSTPVLTVLACSTCAAPASLRLPGLLTSAAMLGFKLAHVEILKLSLDEQKRLEAERAALIAELEDTLSPELALQVEVIMDRRKSFVTAYGLSKVSKVSSPKPAHGLVGGEDAEERARRDSVRQVRAAIIASSLGRSLPQCSPSLDGHSAATTARVWCTGVRSWMRQRMPVPRLPCRCSVHAD